MSVARGWSAWSERSEDHGTASGEGRPASRAARPQGGPRTERAESDRRERPASRGRREIREWAAYVRTHPDEDWGEQVNRVVNAQLQSARHFEDERPDPEELRDSSLLDG